MAALAFEAVGYEAVVINESLVGQFVEIRQAAPVLRGELVKRAHTWSDRLQAI